MNRNSDRSGRSRDRSGARPRGVTIRDVAAEAGVSLQTVSRVMNNRPNVRPAIQELVRKAIEKLGYVPSLAARKMAGNKSYLLLALNDRDRTIEGWQSGDGTDWVDQMLLGGMLKCAEFGYRMIFELVDTHSSNIERELTSALGALHPDGIILTPPHGDNRAITEMLIERRIPFARIGSKQPGPGFRIAMDEQAAANAATRHLIELGHRRIGFITGSSEYALSAERLEGYRAAMRAAGLEDRLLVAHGDFTFRSGEAATRSWLALANRPTAIVASSDQMSLAALDVAKSSDLDVPGGLSIVSFDDTPIVKFSTPPLTAIRQPIAEMAARAAEVLIGANSDADLADGIDILPFQLIVRGSTAPPPQPE
jgi:LacI family transcriptional regulator